MARTVQSMPESFQTQFTEEQWKALPSYTRYRYIKKNGYEDSRLKERPEQILKSRIELYSESEWLALTPTQRYNIKNRVDHNVKRNEARVKAVAANPNYYKEQHKKEKEKDPIKWFENLWRRSLKKNYNITPEQYENMYLAQSGLCAICKQPEQETYKQEFEEGVFITKIKRLSVDHEHHTGVVRGLLCSACNKKLISHNGDALQWLESAVKYLKKGA